MDIKNSREIIAEFIERHNFSHILTDGGLPFGKDGAYIRMDGKEAVEFMVSSAFTGGKVLGFFSQLPAVSIERAVRGECIFISRRLPERIDVPTLFCRRSDDIADVLVLAFKTAADCNLPISVIISDDALNNYAASSKTISDLARISPYLHPAAFKNIFDDASFAACVSVAENAFAAAFKSIKTDSDILSFADSDLPFFSYLLPGVPPENAEILRGKTIKSAAKEAKAIACVLNNSYALGVSFENMEEENVPQAADFLCQGCPFVSIFARIKDKDTVFFTDIKCEGVLSFFPLNNISLASYMGLLSDGLNVKTMFIGSASGYKPSYDSLLRNGRVIFLNDCALSGINICSSVKHPKKITGTKNSLFPYGCANIKKYSRVGVNYRKCRCIKNGESPVCTAVVRCPAIYVKNDTVAIDGNVCTGCLACKIACPFGAVS